MDIEQIRLYCLAKPETSESFPFDEDTLVFKVCNKIFALVSLDEYPPRINLKAEPEKAIYLRDVYPEIIPGYHMNKLHWNTVILEEHLQSKLIMELIDDSYQLIVNKLKKIDQIKIKEQLKSPDGNTIS